MATHSSVLAWRIPGTGEPGGLLSVGSHRVGYNLAAAAAAFEYLRLLLFLLTIDSIFCFILPLLIQLLLNDKGIGAEKLKE